MRTYKNKGQLLIVFLVAGFLIGILYANFVAKDSIMLSSVFEKGSLLQFRQMEIVSTKYLIYVMRERIGWLVFVWILGFVKWKRAYVGTLLGAIGVLTGVLMVSAVMQLGIKGVFICMAGMFPQGIFYGLAYGVLFWYWFQYPISKWNKAKTVFVILMFGIGVVAEGYLNPWIMRGVIGLL